MPECIEWTANGWMFGVRRAIADYGHDKRPGCAEYLRARLETEMTSAEKARSCLFHIAGFVREPSGDHHPEFYFVRNITAIDTTTGAYLGAGPDFYVSEDFWERDCKTPSARAALAAGSFANVYLNGYPDGRVAYWGLNRQFNSFLTAVWSQPSWKFSPPKTLDEIGLVLELLLNAIGTLFKISNYRAPYIGGHVQTLQLKWP